MSKRRFVYRDPLYYHPDSHPLNLKPSDNQVNTSSSKLLPPTADKECPLIVIANKHRRSSLSAKDDESNDQCGNIDNLKDNFMLPISKELIFLPSTIEISQEGSKIEMDEHLSVGSSVVSDKCKNVGNIADNFMSLLDKEINFVNTGGDSDCQNSFVKLGNDSDSQNSLTRNYHSISSTSLGVEERPCFSLFSIAFSHFFFPRKDDCLIEDGNINRSIRLYGESISFSSTGQ